MNAATLESAYLSVIDDLRRSDFAARRQLNVTPQRCHIEELTAITGRLPEKGRFLDIGTGMGIIPETLLRLGHSVVTVDVARTAGQREPLERLIALGAEGYFVWVGPERIPIEDASIDVAFAGDVIEHLPGTPKWFLLEIARTLKPGGHLVLTTPNAVRLPVRLRVALGYSNWPPVSQYINQDKDWPYHIGHHKEYDASELRAVLSHVGFGDIAISFFEDTLRRSGILRSTRDIATQDRLFTHYWKDGRRGFSIGEAARLAMLAAVQAVPSFRSTLLAVARAPRATS